MKAINDTINEARELRYQVSFLLPGVNAAPSFTVLVPAKYARAFEEFLENEQDNTVFHASDEDGEFEI